MIALLIPYGVSATPHRPKPSLRDANEHLDIHPASFRQAARLLGRALMLRCPNCGKGPVLKHWLKMRAECGNCGIRMERGEKDYFIGSMMWNLLLSEVLFITIFVGVLVVRWPNVPWDALQISAPAGMLLAPFLLFPFSKLVWLAFNLILRPERVDSR
jgi:uncharacterized protein (DUF983 family)